MIRSAMLLALVFTALVSFSVTTVRAAEDDSVQDTSASSQSLEDSRSRRGFLGQGGFLNRLYGQRRQSQSDQSQYGQSVETSVGTSNNGYRGIWNRMSSYYPYRNNYGNGVTGGSAEVGLPRAGTVAPVGTDVSGASIPGHSVYSHLQPQMGLFNNNLRFRRLPRMFGGTGTGFGFPRYFGNNLGESTLQWFSSVFYLLPSNPHQLQLQDSLSKGTYQALCPAVDSFNFNQMRISS
jgi:hypothetical protein